MCNIWIIVYCTGICAEYSIHIKYQQLQDIFPRGKIHGIKQWSNTEWELLNRSRNKSYWRIYHFKLTDVAAAAIVCNSQLYLPPSQEMLPYRFQHKIGVQLCSRNLENRCVSRNDLNYDKMKYHRWRSMKAPRHPAIPGVLDVQNAYYTFTVWANITVSVSVCPWLVFNFMV